MELESFETIETILTSDTIFHMLEELDDHLYANKLRKITSIIIIQKEDSCFESRIYSY